MARELLTTWQDYRGALDRILALAKHQILIYDEDLAQLALESPDRLAVLQRILQSNRQDGVRIALRNADAYLHHHPKLQRLMATYSHVGAVQQTPPQISHLRDAILIVDECNALIRFERDLPRGKLLLEESEEIRPYRRKFEEIWQEHGEFLSPTKLGL